jgi:hypothetical protein
MAMSNARSLKTTLKIFFKENGRYPVFDEFRNLVLGKNAKEKQALVADETKQSNTQG